MYKRIVLKLSGEALAGNKGFSLDSDRVIEITFDSDAPAGLQPLISLIPYSITSK